MEVFTHSTTWYRRYLASDRARRQPSLAHMRATGHVLVDTPLAAEVRREAQELLEGGPQPLSPAELDAGRYTLTDLLDDLQGAGCPAQRFLITAQLALAWPNFVLAVHRQWGGQGKWALRQLRRFSPGLARDFAAALEECCSHNAGPLVELVDRTLEPLGGPSPATGHWGVASE